MEEVTIAAETGRPTGSRASRRLRGAGKVPAVLYGHGIDAVSLAVDQRALRNALSGEAGLNALITLELDGTRHLAMARHLQRDPIRGSVDHVDFVIVRRDEVVTADVPVHLVGEATAVLNEDGIIDQQLFSLSIRALPTNIPPSLEVDVSGLAIGDSIRVGDVKLPEGVTTDVDEDATVVVGQPPRVEEVPEPTEEELTALAAAAEEAGVSVEELEGLEGVPAPEAAEGGDAESTESTESEG